MNAFACLYSVSLPLLPSPEYTIITIQADTT